MDGDPAFDARRICRKDGSFVDITLGEKPGEPQFTVTDLLVHLAREQLKKPLGASIEGEKLNILIGSRPLPGADEDGKDLVKLNVLNILNEKFGITEEDFVSADIAFVPAAAPVDIGFDRSMVGSYGQDDRSCAYAALMAVVKAKTPYRTIVTVLADREEIGSDGNTGLNSSFMRYFIEDLAEADGVAPRHVLSRSRCLSADVTAAYDPNYPEVYEAMNSTYLNGGVGMSKYTGAGGKSGTNEASAEFVQRDPPHLRRKRCALADRRARCRRRRRRRDGRHVYREPQRRRRRCRRAGALDACAV